MKRHFLKTFPIIKYALPAASLLFSAITHSAVGWMNGDSQAIWFKDPGFYKEGNDWYVIVHAPSNVDSVRIKIVSPSATDPSSPNPGDIKDEIELNVTPDAKFWWFKGTDASFDRVPQHGDFYRYVFTDDGVESEHQDPAARWVQHSGVAEGWSKVYMSDNYQWVNTTWQPPGWEYYNIYQVHPLRMTSRNVDGAGNPVAPFQQIIEEINNDGVNDYINNLNVTALQLMPVNEFPVETSWGYNPAYFYAIEGSYGGPDKLKELVDTAHQNGMAFIIDVVYNHANSSPGDNIMSDIDHDAYYDGDTQWGPMLNFDNDIAWHYMVRNITYLAREFKVDGIRVDHTKTMRDHTSYVTQPGSGGGWEISREMRRRVKEIDENIILIAEELPNWWGLTQENVGSEWYGDWHGPFDSQWTDNFHDRFKDVLAGAHLNNLYQVFTYFGDNWFDGLIYTESHDEVGNEDRRVAKIAREGKGWEMDQVALAGTVLGRGIPMVFMGQEGGETRQFHIDWWSDRLDLNDYEAGARNKIRTWYSRLNDIRRADLWKFGPSAIQITHIHDGNGVAAFTRDNGKYLVVLNFKGNNWSNYNVGVSGVYQELANTSWDQYRINTSAPVMSRGGDTGHSITGVDIPAYGAVVLVRWD